MNFEIELGQHYLLDGKTDVIALKVVNRAKTVYNVEIPGKSILSVERERLSKIVEETETPGKS
ncbi:hypothetical protein [Dawidia soli]|uniref:Uncharacterized protein n=1 Tax=Dawidia soli TaxID=2782352 RepID=A0AAP2DF22_9BACT|nr:hypothetical protein [Dawidia soli]MBT1690564.1 hypothetical protein [Dawidia soli]